MNRRITIHEYESVSESELGDNFASLEKLVMANRGGGTDPLELLSLSVRRSVGKVATARNHVGVITFSDGVELEILPKIGSAMDCDDPDGASRMIFLRMLRTVFDLPFKEFDVATVNSKRMSVFEFFISMFVRETEKLLKNGLSSSYYEVRGNEPFLKGRVDFSENLKRNAVHRQLQPLRFRIGRDRLQCLQIPMDIRNSRKFHSYSPIFYSWLPICKDDK